MKRVVIPVCPICQRPIDQSVVVDSDRPGYPDSVFWGDPSDRVGLCWEGAFVHFWAGGLHRLAYLTRIARSPEATAARQGTLRLGRS